MLTFKSKTQVNGMYKISLSNGKSFYYNISSFSNCQVTFMDDGKDIIQGYLDEGGKVADFNRWLKGELIKNTLAKNCVQMDLPMKYKDFVNQLPNNLFMEDIDDETFTVGVNLKR